MTYTPHHTAISVRDLDVSVKFYSSLGFRQVHRYDEENGSMSIVHMKLAKIFLEIFCYEKNKKLPKLSNGFAGEPDVLGVKHFALHTDDITGTLKKMQIMGYAASDSVVIQGRTKVAYFFIQDPDGMWVEFVNDERYSQ